ncbi:K(+)/H(+) antiporter YhaU [compost metagenome]
MNIGLTIMGRGEFSIILVNLGKAGGLASILQPFAALYVLVLAILGPLLAKESKQVFKLLDRVFRFEARHVKRKEQQRQLQEETSPQ